MKRVLFITMLLLVAGLTQAGSVNWGTGAAVTDGGVPIVSGDCYLVYVGAATSYTWGSGTIIDSGYAEDLAASINQDPFALALANSQPAGQTFSYAPITGLPDANVGGHYFIVFTSQNTGGSLTLPASGDWGASQMFTQTSTGILPADNFYSGAVALTPIPEPCTMALAFVGAGAMALRRRFAKKS